jgi:hypothetical protein
VSWREETKLRDLDDTVRIEATCLRCGYTWRKSSLQLLLQVIHRDVYMDEVARNLACPKMGCRHVGVRLALIKPHDTSGFVAGMP